MNRDPGKLLDELLVMMAKGGSATSFREIVVRWSPRLRRHALRMLADAQGAEDVVQDAWLGIARSLRGLDDPARFPGWAYAIVSRRCVDVLRRRYRDSRLTNEAAAEAGADCAGSGPSSGVDDRLDLAAAISRLSIDQRLLISLHYGEDLSVAQIAIAHDLSPGTVKSRLHAARQTLRTYLQGDEHDQGG